MKKNTTPKFCSECGVPFVQGSRFCGECGATIVQPTQQKKSESTERLKKQIAQGINKTANYLSRDRSKNKATATLMAMFLGIFGGHKFYMGSWGWGIVYLLTFWLIIPILITIVETVRYVLMTDEEFRVKAEAFRGKGPFGFFW